MNNKIDISIYNLWNNFIKNSADYKNREIPESWYFCDNEKDANECAELVVQGIKQATSTSVWWFEKNNHKLPKVGDLYIITNWKGKARAIIETTKVEKIPFNKITAEYAKIEGEGDKSLKYWKETHWKYYTREMKSSGEKPYEDMIIVCEQFKTIWTENTIANTGYN